MTVPLTTGPPCHKSGSNVSIAHGPVQKSNPDHWDSGPPDVTDGRPRDTLPDKRKTTGSCQVTDDGNPALVSPRKVSLRTLYCIYGETRLA